MSGLQGGKSFAGAGSFSVGITGAGNLNGNAAIDGSFSSGERNDDDEEADIQSYTDQEIRTKYNVGEEMATNNRNDLRQRNVEIMETNNNAHGSSQFGNVNSQSSINQSGMANSNKQGGVMQQAFRRQNNSIEQQPNQHIVCSYHYKTIYPNIQLQSSNVESNVIESNLRNANDQSLVGQYAMRRFYSGPFNHLL